MSLLANSESAQLEFLLEFGQVQARFIKTLLFLRSAYEPQYLHKKKRTYRSNSQEVKTVETPTPPRDQYISEIVVLWSSTRVTDYEAVLGFGGAAAFAIV